MDVGCVLAVIVGAGSVERMLRDSAVSSEPLGIVELHRQIHVRFVVFVRLGALGEMRTSSCLDVYEPYMNRGVMEVRA